MIAISRTPALSYFDHPPLHQWILTAWVAAFGEGRAARLPFFGCSLVTAVALFFIARRLFSRRRGLVDGVRLRGQRLFPRLSRRLHHAGPAAADVLGARGLGGGGNSVRAARTRNGAVARRRRRARAGGPRQIFGDLHSPWPPWLFPESRRARGIGSPIPRPYIGAAIALLCLTPALIWNAEHGWVSLAFQSGRAANRLTLSGKALGNIVSVAGRTTRLDDAVDAVAAASPGLARGVPPRRRQPRAIPAVARRSGAACCSR